MSEEPKLRPVAVSPQDAAILMAVSEATILRLIKARKLKATRLGRQWRILLTDLKRGTADTQ